MQGVPTCLPESPTRHWCHKEQFEDLGQDAYWATSWEVGGPSVARTLGISG